MIVAIHAFENTYCGLYGIENHRVIEVDSIKEAEEWAAEESREVMDSYEDVMEGFINNAESYGLEEGTEEYDEYIEECIQENIGYQIWEVVDRYASLAEMENDFFNSKDEFIKNHCRELE